MMDDNLENNKVMNEQDWAKHYDEKIKLTKENLISYIYHYDYVSYSEIARTFDCKGYCNIKNKKYNIIICYGLNIEAINLILELKDKGIIVIEPCSMLIYLTDGGIIPNIPTAKKVMVYKEERWIPTVLRHKDNLSTKIGR